ncbi:adenosine monophosphate-protein transferase [candidate division WOR-3 bacterium]|uniref:Adenosine monophosphate-protein transferase n=1 Tax=candidate division WOR-3 bacterium TaxID=2052148 RepID=A0A660SEY8_UNCW3|nr:MAG: adenosine monophosphate-protein transferase [candidate division WOR-3 bacterium]
MEIKATKIDVPEGVNVVLGQTHFIKTVEDIYEAIVNTNPTIKFGIGFCEASGPRLVRWDGNDDELVRLAKENAFKIGAGHFFIIYLKEGFPINILPRLKEIPEICTIFCATANPVTVLYIDHGEGRGIVGVVDGFRSKGIEGPEDIKKRREFLRKIGYKF